MTEKKLPFDRSELEAIASQVPTPFHIYDEKALRQNAREFAQAFNWVEGGFCNHFAVKALPNPHILEILREEGMGADCSSLAELLLCQAAQIPGEKIVFTSNDTPANEFQKAFELGALINLDDLSHLTFLHKALGGKLPKRLSFRYNPGPLKQGNAIIGKPEEAKYGLTREQLFGAYKTAAELGVETYSPHTMVA
ncbi:MAG: diaminopimelate decarboxylase, partial [Spirochaetales bacterium]|nr:diaminopimelate decarboxylase [Spirochaetales bacterium]